METLAEPPVTHTTPYISLLWEVSPLIIGAFLVAFFRGWAGVKKSYLHQHFWSTVFNILFSSAVMAAVAVGVTLCLPLFGFDHDPHIDLGLTLLLSGSGMKAADAFIRWRAGYRIVSTSETKSGAPCGNCPLGGNHGKNAG